MGDGRRATRGSTRTSPTAATTTSTSRDPNFRHDGVAAGQLEVSYTPQDQVDQNWIADTLFVFYGSEARRLHRRRDHRPAQPGWLWTGREHVFRSTNYGLNPAFPTWRVLREHCNVWYGRLRRRRGRRLRADDRHLRRLEAAGQSGRRRPSDGHGVRRATDKGRRPRRGGRRARPRTTRRRSGRRRAPAASSSRRTRTPRTRRRSSSTGSTTTLGRRTTPPRYPTAIFVDPEDANHAWITYSGFNAKTPTTPGHVFEVRYVAGRLDVQGARRDDLR